MAAPTLQAQGATSAVTSGAPAVTIPTHQADDILVVAASYWGPNTAGDAAQIPTPSGWTLLGTQVGQPAAANRDGWLAWFWKRATGAGTTVTLTTGASWDSGTDTNYGARAYVIRGCVTTGNPWDAAATAGPHTTANQAFPAVTVSGTERMVVIFGNMEDNATFAMTSSGWTTGTVDNDPAGTDCSFQTARKDNVSSSTSADTATVSAPAQGAYAYMGVSFKPPLVAALLEAAVTGTGTVAAALTTEIRMAAAVSGTGTVAAALTTAITLVVAVTGTGAVVGVLTTEITLVGAVSGTGVVAAELTATQQSLLEAAISGTGVIAGVLTTEIRMAAAVTGTGVVAADLTTIIALVAAIGGSGVIVGSLTTEITMDGALVGTGIVAGALLTEITLVGVLLGTGIVLADLTAPGGGGATPRRSPWSALASRTRQVGQSSARPRRGLTG